MNTKNIVAKGTFWSAALFYILIAFEFFYMAGPFAAYFYSAYAPALNFFNDTPILSWLDEFFLPHAVRETSSAIINAHEVIGAGLAAVGFVAFCVGACQVYYNKLTKKGVVTAGIYNLVRHPQYVCFMICSLGLLILWPRYIVAIMFVTMIFAYYLLAKIEEKECTAKFGKSYIDYKNKTNMFLPFRIRPISKLRLPQPGKKRAIVLLAAYFMTLAVVLGCARGLQALSINSLYAVYTANSADVAVCEIAEEKIKDIMQIVRADSKVADMLSDFSNNDQYINYILPAEWYAAEIPMNDVQLGKGHHSPDNYDPNLYKVIITRVILRNKNVTPTASLLTNVYLRQAIAEVWVDLSAQNVTQTLDMPENVRYEGIPVAIY